MEIPYQRLSGEVLRNLIESFILREGTDYGTVELTLEQKVDNVKKLLEKKKVSIVFDEELETCSIQPK